MRSFHLLPLLSVLIFACTPTPEIESHTVAQTSETIERAERVTEKVRRKARATEKAEGKQDLVKDQVRVKQTNEGEPVIVQTGEASMYGRGFHGKTTANGEKFNKNDLTAAHPTLPLGSTATVTNLESGKSVDVRINDRGPYVKGRDIDLSEKAARELEMTKNGVAPVKIEAKLPDGDETKNTAGSGAGAGKTP